MSLNLKSHKLLSLIYKETSKTRKNYIGYDLIHKKLKYDYDELREILIVLEGEAEVVYMSGNYETRDYNSETIRITITDAGEISAINKKYVKLFFRTPMNWVKNIGIMIGIVLAVYSVMKNREQVNKSELQHLKERLENIESKMLNDQQ